jgi:hypothetical protein
MKLLIFLPALFSLFLITACNQGGSDSGAEGETTIEADKPDEEGTNMASDENKSTLSWDKIPEGIREHLTNGYPGAEFREAKKVTAADGGVTYEVKTNYKGKLMKFTYTAEGQFAGFKVMGRAE